jgi:hypothetical protein
MEVSIKGYQILFDDEDSDIFNERNWYIQKTKDRAVLCGLRKASEKWATIYFARELMKCPKGMFVDHINGNAFDNRRVNLRVCTRAQNNQNARKRKTNQSGKKGVSWSTAMNKWKAQIRHENVIYYLGCHDTVELAHEAYKIKAKELHGEYARFE